MLFNSIKYMIFLPIVFFIYWLLPHKYRKYLLLISSYYFYMSWNPIYILLILSTTLISYISGILLESRRNKKIIAFVGIFMSLSILIYFKYFNFLSSNITKILELFTIKIDPVMINVLLPVGISFYTFQTIGYLIDVYYGEAAERDFISYATFVSFFPQLVAGPIERTKNLLPQLKQKHIFNYNQATYGIKLMLLGFFKKLVIADTLAIYVNQAFGNVINYSGFSLVLAVLFFTIEIYCDFSGYSDIAVGTAKLFGINLMTNFKSPYFSSSLKEFWNNWHISLSTWFKDYVYIPLGGSRKGKFKTNVNLMIVFLLSGLWHGASWTYIIWGFIHGTARIFENIFLQKIKKIKWVNIIFVFTFCSFAWIFFRVETLSDAIIVIKNMFIDIIHPFTYIKAGFSDLNISSNELIKIIMPIISLFIYDYVSLKIDIISWISTRKTFVRWLIYVFVVFLILYLIPSSNTSEFIYFQF
ncbi:MAG: MBOAT family protein [Bacilli bacterium]|nr:MBOAT family protein [Bacilli bacterium]